MKQYQNKQRYIAAKGKGWFYFAIIMSILFAITLLMLFIMQATTQSSNLTQNASQKTTTSTRADKITTDNKSEQYMHANNPAETLAMIDKYQARYFEIVKRNDFLLQLIEYDEYEQDERDLLNLYREVESKIDQDNYYLRQYRNIEDKYAENPGETTVDMNDFAAQEYDAVDKLLNEVYQEVKTKISAEDFKNLTSSELKWIKEVETYRKTFDAQGYGSIGTLKYFGYKTDMHSFRTLLLMLYL